LALLWCIAAEASTGAAEPSTTWRTGTDFQRQLHQPLSLIWEQVELGKAFQQLATTQRVAIVVDRRLDPQRSLDLQIHGEPLLAVIEQALPTGFAVAQLDCVLYVGPESTARWLRTLAHRLDQQVRQLPTSQQRIWQSRKALAWPVETEPRALVERLLRDARVALAQAERIPHDLWPAGDLPPLSLVDRLTLLLAQFDLTWKWTDPADQIELVPIEPPVTVTREYPSTPTLQRRLQELGAIDPSLKSTLSQDRLSVTGRLEQHEQLITPQKSTQAKRPPAESNGETSGRFQLKVPRAPLKKVLDQLAAQARFTWQADPRLIEQGTDLDALVVQLDVTGLTLDQLLAALLEPHGLDFRRDGTRVTILPSP